MKRGRPRLKTDMAYMMLWLAVQHHKRKGRSIREACGWIADDRTDNYKGELSHAVSRIYSTGLLRNQGAERMKKEEQRTGVKREKPVLKREPSVMRWDNSEYLRHMYYEAEALLKKQPELRAKWLAWDEL